MLFSSAVWSRKNVSVVSLARVLLDLVTVKVIGLLEKRWKLKAVEITHPWWTILTRVSLRGCCRRFKHTIFDENGRKSSTIVDVTTNHGHRNVSRNTVRRAGPQWEPHRPGRERPRVSRWLSRCLCLCFPVASTPLAHCLRAFPPSFVSNMAASRAHPCLLAQQSQHFPVLYTTTLLAQQSQQFPVLYTTALLASSYLRRWLSLFFSLFFFYESVLWFFIFCWHYSFVLILSLRVWDFFFYCYWFCWSW